MTDVIQVTTTTAHREEAQAIAEQLLSERLAACVQISGPVESLYWWNGQVERGHEFVCVIKTRRQLFPHVEAMIKLLHSYEEPEILAVPAVAGSAGYLKWVAESVAS